MIIHKKLIADWKLIYTRRRAQQIRDNERENRSRTNYECTYGDTIRIITMARERKEILFGFEHSSPYDITSDHANGTVIIRCGNSL